ncbi:MAG: WbuC family cupin fold metalloprotein [Proteobacteria bacterium]|nr:WbuC family cupin fold metalloprotein [Pseudomonadota bacterium]
MKLLTGALLDELTARAQASPRSRAHHNIHATPEDPVQRFVVVAQGASYFRPHRHTVRSELAVVVRGSAEVITFDGEGRVTARYPAGGENLAWETPPNTWHTVLPGAAGVAFVEIKQGPYDPATAAEFAPWAPVEGGAEVGDFQAWLRAARPGDVAPRR